MAKGNIVKWITIKGRRIPIYEDGSMGGFMEGKQHQEKSEGRKTYRVYYEDGNQKLLEADSKEELDAYLKEHEKENGKVSRTETADEYDKKEKEDFVVDYKIPDDPNYEKKRMAREIADENDAYDREHKEGKYTEEEKSQSSFGKEFQGKADEYREKFLTKRTDEEIAEIKKNLDKSAAIVGTTHDDDIAYRAIRDEQERRKRDKLSQETYDNRTYAELNDAQKKSIDEELSGKESWSKMQTERSTKEASDIFKNQQEKERRAEANKGKSIKVGNKEVAVSKTAAESSMKAIRNENGSYSMGDYTISKRTGYEWVTPTNGSRISTKQKKRTGYSVAGKTFNTLSEAKAYVEELMRKRK